jgi:hypothetical protein
MLLRMNEWTRIEDPREYGPVAVNDLRNLLTAGGCAQLDPRRENFYELEYGGHTFYIHISPINQNVTLVAKWLNSPKEVCTSAAHLAA